MFAPLNVATCLIGAKHISLGLGSDFTGMLAATPSFGMEARGANKNENIAFE
jgi:hypothetical protein